MSIENELEVIKKKILFLHQRGIKAHIKLNSGIFYNGLITELSDAWFLIEDPYTKEKYGDYPNVWFMDVKECDAFIFKGDGK